jgi:hypothetical protein
MMRALVQEASDANVINEESSSQAGSDPQGHELTSEAAHAVAQSLAADVLASLATDPQALPPGEPWQALGFGEGAPVGSVGSVGSSERPGVRSPFGVDAMPRSAEAQPEATHAELRSDVARLEELLATQAQALREARAEAEQLRALARDAAMRFAGLPDSAADAERARADREHAFARAIEAEAGRAELAFQLDEVRGHLVAAGAGEGGLPGEPLHITCARLTGTVRGLLAARAEAEERRDMGWARAVLLEQDLEDARISLRVHQRELAEARDQLELAMAEARTLGARLADAIAAAQAAEQAREQTAEQAAEQAREHTQERAVRAQALAAADARIVELERALARETENVAEAESRLARGEADRLLANAQNERAELALGAKDVALEQLRTLQRAELDRLSEARAAVERLAAERSRAHTHSVQTLHEVRDALDELSRAVERVMSTSTATEPGAPSPFEPSD